MPKIPAIKNQQNQKLDNIYTIKFKKSKKAVTPLQGLLTRIQCLEIPSDL